MSALKIAVIDSGINPDHPHICAPTVAVNFDPEELDYSCTDMLGHGTAVTAAIQEKAPEASYYILKLFGKSLRTTGDRLIRAIGWAVEHEMDVVNLSLGTANPCHRAALEALVARAVAANVLVVAARYSEKVPVLPGMLDGVISVDVDWNLPRDQFRVENQPDGRVFYASGLPRPLPGVPVSRNLSGISFAVANMTGFVARACQGLEQKSVPRVISLLTSETQLIS